ncbi:hypothetical protein CCACVL1_03875 [Corchorus capsularis]|uniref:Uncharacterized protein n=1 Tax=Corchorus capsularis TaxID=210143 RepID=A0A1R3JWT5_COCAP|nr:hypothetical protein CCACVL1_03875 [Corchorus capsularis]
MARKRLKVNSLDDDEEVEVRGEKYGGFTKF